LVFFFLFSGQEFAFSNLIMQLSPIDLNYLHQESIGGVIAEGLTVLYNT
jgi:hypothetical protein